MCTFDAPISRCEAMHCMVITDQTQRQCAAEHECPKGMKCPLGRCFTGLPVRSAPVAPRRRASSERLAA